MGRSRILVITSQSAYALGVLFVNALRGLGHEVLVIDMFAVQARYVRGGRLGRTINTFWPVETWQRKANRELAVAGRTFQPDLLIISGDNPVQLGSLAFLRSVIPGLKVVLYWPDTLVNVTPQIAQLHPVIDMIASYSETALGQFRDMGFKQGIWLPFAGDTGYLGSFQAGQESAAFKYDISFIGGWRPERERLLGLLTEAFPDKAIRIVGPSWSKRVRRKRLVAYAEDQPRYGHALGDFIRSSRINLNIIDDTNYPAANMRFFEIPAAGGLELCSPCPEMADVFEHGKHMFYYTSDNNAVEKVKYILGHPDHAWEVRQAGHQFVLAAHTYAHRMETLLNQEK